MDAEQSEAFRTIYNKEISGSWAALPGGIDLPFEFYNNDDSLFRPKGAFIQTDSDQYVTDFALSFSRASFCEKALLWDDYMAMEKA
jgi:hypothetical protein